MVGVAVGAVVGGAEGASVPPKGVGAAVGSAVSDGRLSPDRLDASLERIARVKSMITPPPAFDNDRLDDLCDAILALEQRLGDNN